MKPRWRPILTAVVVLLVFLIQLKRGFHPVPEPGMIQTGAMPAAEGVVFAALLSALLTAAVLWAVFALWDRWKKR